MAQSKLPVTVSQRLWEAMAEDVTPAFADTYLSGAREFGNRLTPYTVTAFQKIRANRWALACLRELGIELVEPLPVGHPDRPDTRK